MSRKNKFDSCSSFILKATVIEGSAAYVVSDITGNFRYNVDSKAFLAADGGPTIGRWTVILVTGVLCHLQQLLYSQGKYMPNFIFWV